MITGIIRTEESTKYSKEVVWTFQDLDKRVEKEDILLSEVISLEQEEWRVSLNTLNLLGSRYINISISRIAMSDNISIFSPICWHAGILDRDGVWRYDRSGLVRQKAASNEWMTVAYWSGPEWTYMIQEKDLYMPYGRLKFVLQFRWGPKCLYKDSQGTKMTRIVDSLKRKDYVQHTKTVFWTIDDPQRRLEEFKTLRSDTFSFGCHVWQLTLNNVLDTSRDSYCPETALSRVTFSTSTLLPFSFSSMFLRTGFLATDGSWEYNCVSYTTLYTSLQKIILVDCSVPEFRNIWMDKNIPRERLTFVVHLGWKKESLLPLSKVLPLSRTNQVSDDSSGEDSYSVVLKVKETTFQIHRSILEMFSPVLHAMACVDDPAQFLHLPDCEPRAFEVFLHFAYLGEIEGLEGAVVDEVYYFADIYDVLELKKECVRRLLATMNPESVCRVLDLAQKHGDEELKEKAVEFVVTNAREVFRSDAWLKFMVTHTILARDLIIRSYDKREWSDRPDA